MVKGTGMGEFVERDVVWVGFDLMERFAVDVFRGVGVPDGDARICADVLIAADRRGIYSHGVNRMKPIYYDRIKAGIQHAVTNFEIVREGPTTAVVDGHDGMGQVIAARSMALAVGKARKHGMGMVVARNSTHYGIAGYYAMMAAEADMIGITGTNARPSVAPTFGVEAMLGTNPLTFGMPTDEPFPFVLDCATSISQRGKIEAYAKTEERIPDSWVITGDGEGLSDPLDVLKGFDTGACALTPLGGIGEETAGYKGYGYSTVVEILSAALSGGSFLRMLAGSRDGKKGPYHLGHFFIAVDVKAFIDPAEFKKTAGDILRALRASRKMPGRDRIYTAGEKEHLYWNEMKDRGIPLNRVLRSEMLAMRDELGLTGYDFGFPEGE
jgi:LDH2 family malate/lactate/ureidoglycolate dehydrogenase